MNNHLLIVDDDEKLRRLLGQYLTRSGFVITEASHPKEAEELLRLFSFDALVMDVMMPHQNGVEYTRILRKKGLKTPILILTAMGDTLSRISGLEAGADDYLCKPFDPKELLLRLNNLLKHQSKISDAISFGPFSYEKGYLKFENKKIKLTSSEQNLLTVLAHSINQPIAREELARQTHTASARTIDTQIARLRQKIEKDIKHPFWIQTVRGKGYKLVNS